MNTQINTDETPKGLGELYDPVLERTVLASVINSYSTMTDARPILRPDSFFNLDHREIFAATADIYDHGGSPDMMLVWQELKKSGSSVTPARVYEICGDSTWVMDAVPHAHELNDLARRRELYLAGRRLMSEAVDRSKPIEEIHASAKGVIDGLLDTPQCGTLTLTEANKRVIDIMVANQSRPEGETFGSPTGFPQLDRNGGLCPGDLTVVGAETSQGKTSFATAMALNAAMHGDPVAIYSMEMTAEQLAARIAAMRSGVSASKILFSPLPSDDINRISDCMALPPGSGEIYFDPKSRSTIESILMSVRVMVMRHGVKGVVVDYLQLVTASDRSLNREQATAKIARDLKNIAKELGIWVIAISQLSRDRSTPVPSLSRLRDSGQIEEAADNIILIYRPRDGKSYPDDFVGVSTEGTALVTLAKGRNVGLAQFICGFKPENTLFFPIAEDNLPMDWVPIQQAGVDNEPLPF